MMRNARAVTLRRRPQHGPRLVCVLLSGLLPVTAHAVETVVAAATNFAEVMERLEPDFEAHTGYHLTVVTGSTGKLYAQIANGAPFDVLLAADQERPRLLEEDGLAVPGTRFTYAFGRLTLWSPDPRRVAADGAATLRNAEFRRLAMANADLAPYGAAARETLQALGLYRALEGRLVVGENVGQAFGMVATGNAELGFVALSSVLSPRNRSRGSRWDVPAELYAPIRQDAVLLLRGRDNAAARAFLRWMRGDKVHALLAQYGYAVK